MAKMSDCVFPCLLILASEMFSLPLPMQKSYTILSRRRYSGVQAPQAVLLLEKTYIPSRNKNNTSSYHFLGGDTLLTRFGLQESNKWVDFFKGLVIKDLFEIWLFSKSFSVVDAIHLSLTWLLYWQQKVSDSWGFWYFRTPSYIRSGWSDGGKESPQCAELYFPVSHVII